MPINKEHVYTYWVVIITKDITSRHEDNPEVSGLRSLPASRSFGIPPYPCTLVPRYGAGGAGTNHVFTPHNDHPSTDGSVSI